MGSERIWGAGPAGVSVCVHSGLEKSWPVCFLGRLMTEVCVPASSSESGAWFQSRCLQPLASTPTYQEEEESARSGALQHPYLAQGLLSGRLLPFLHLGLALWSSDDSRNLEAAVFRWHQTHHVCGTFLVLAQAFPLPGKPTLPYSAFKTECKCLPPRQNQWSPPPRSQREASARLLLKYFSWCSHYYVFLTRVSFLLDRKLAYLLLGPQRLELGQTIADIW